MKRTFLTLATWLCTLILSAQSLPYPTDTIKGKVFLRYPVQKSEGLYRISKNFGVSQEDIVTYNPELQTTGLRVGQTILIPYIEQIDSTQYIVHELLPKETLYGLSKQYGVKVEDIQRLNPETSKRMAIGTRLLIPKNVENNPVTLLPVNPPRILSTDTLKRSNSTTHPVATLPFPVTDTVFFKVPLPLQDSIMPLSDIPGVPLRIAFMLPFMANTVNRDANIDRFVEFYEGALLAVHEAQQSGKTFEIYTYDTEKGDVHIRQQIAFPELRTIDAIIGPAYPSQASIISSFVFENHIPVLIPFTQKVSDLKRNPWLLQFNPTEQQESEAICTHFAPEKERINFVFFNAPEKDIPYSVLLLRKEIIRQGFSTTSLDLETLATDSAETAFAVGKKNIVLFNSERFSHIAPYMKPLETLAHKTDITLLSRYTWQKEIINIPQVYTSVFSSTESASYEYDALYKYYFNRDVPHTQPRYDLLGYDLTTWLIRMLSNDPSKDIQERIVTTEYQGIQSYIHFHHTQEREGFENTGLQVITR